MDNVTQVAALRLTHSHAAIFAVPRDVCTRHVCEDRALSAADPRALTRTLCGRCGRPDGHGTYTATS